MDGEFTLYDARERHPTRSEYRLYYSIPHFDELVRAGDLLVLLRDDESGGLQGIVAGSGTSIEGHLEDALMAGDSAALRRFLFRDGVKAKTQDAAELVQTLLPFPAKPALDIATRSDPTYLEAVDAAMLPPTLQMARAGRQIAAAVWGSGLNADEFVRRGLEAETELFFAIEREVGTRSLRELMSRSGTELDAVLSWALRLQQSRKARRGQSLQHHFAFLLEREGIPFTAQCPTERGETPDFVIPGLEKYRDRNCPDERLRMVACKSTVRERWVRYSRRLRGLVRSIFSQLILISARIR